MFLVPLAMTALEAVGVTSAAAGTAAAAGTTAAAGVTAAAAAAPAFSVWQGVSLLGSAVSAIGSISQGNAQAEAMRLQATNAIIQGNAQSMEYQRQGISVMRRVAETEATIRARAGAGGIDPFSGSAGQLGELAFSRGLDEYNWARDNASMAVMSGQSNAAAYRSAAGSAQTAGYFNAGTSLLMGVGKFGSTGGFTQVGTGLKSLMTPVG